MGRPKEPVDLLVAKGNKHLTKEEYYRRKEEEIDVPYKDVSPPEYLTGIKQIEEFNHYADMLLDIGIFTQLDVDCLARYIMSKQLYLKYTELLVQATNGNDIEKMSKMQILQDKAFRQCRDSARDLGLTITTRARLVVPHPRNDCDEEL